MNWNEILEKLRRVAPTDAQWDSLESFVDDLRELVEEKQREAGYLASFRSIEHDIAGELSDTLRRLDKSAPGRLLELIQGRPIDLLDHWLGFTKALHQYKHDRALTFDSIVDEQRHREQLTSQELDLLSRLAEISADGRSYQPIGDRMPGAVEVAADFQSVTDSPTQMPQTPVTASEVTDVSDSLIEDRPQPNVDPTEKATEAAPPIHSSISDVANINSTSAHLSSKKQRMKERKARRRQRERMGNQVHFEPPPPSRSKQSDKALVAELWGLSEKPMITVPKTDAKGISAPTSTKSNADVEMKVLANDADVPTSADVSKTEDQSGARSGPQDMPESGKPPESVNMELNHFQASFPVKSVKSAPTVEATSKGYQSDSTFLGEAISSRDFAGAYWWCRSEETRGKMPPVSSQACAMAQGVLWNPRSDFAVANDLRETAASFNGTSSLSSELIVSAAAMRVALTAPSVGMNHLLVCKSCLPKYHVLLQRIQSFAERGLKIEATVIGEQLSIEKLNQAIQDARNAAARWIDEGINRRFSFKPAERVWREFLRNDDFLKGLFDVIERDRQSKCESLRSKLEVWRQRPYILTRIKEADEKTNRKFATDIDAGALEKLVSGCFDAAEMCAAWCDAVTAKQETESPQDWVGKQVAELRQSMKKLLPDAKTELAELQTTRDQLQVGAAAFALESCELVRSIIAPDETPLTTISTDDNSNYLLGLQPRGLWPAMRRRLWSLPNIRFVDDGGPYEEDIPAIAQALSLASKNATSLESIFRQRVEDQDFRHTDEMLVLLQESHSYLDLQETLHSSIAAASQSLFDKIESVEAMVQDAILNGSLNEPDRLEIENDLKWQRDSEPRSFRVHWDKLISVESKLHDLRQEHLHDLQITWRTDQERLLSLLDDIQKDSIAQRVQAAFESDEPRVVQEILSQLQVAASRHEIPELAPATVGYDLLAQFHESQALMIDMAKDWKLNLLNAGDPTVTEALESWKQLRKLDIRKDDKSLLSVLSFLGLSSNLTTNILEVASSKKHDWTHVTAKVGDSGYSPIPQYGSLREGMYDILLVGSRNSGSPANAIATALKNSSLQRRPAIVCFQGVLLPEQRMNMARKLRSSSMPAIVLDESLLLWLAQITEQRWSTFLRVALAFSFSSPYAPTGSVPREMFFGRERMLDSILDFEGSGSSVVFGGRQLGKTALLHRARREFHSPRKGHYAIYESIQHLGDPISDVPATEIGRVLRDRLNETLLKDSPIKTRELESVTSHVRRFLETNPGVRLLILLDEADDFLAQDANQNFKFVIELKKLMEQSNRHVKVVFAGLNSVQRYQRYPNQPFAHLGNPIEVGPLEPAPAYQLIAQPMHDIGYRFENDAAILKVLSYTNHHPGLIQFFCDELVKGFQNSAIPNWPPLLITNKAVRELYARSGTKQEIAKRFSWTIDLNPLFNAIICKVLLDQFELQSTASVNHRVDELLASLKKYWPAAFAPMAEEDLRTLLNDMCGLGIFFRSESGYQLRNPNLSDAIGSYEEVIARLDAMKDAPAPQASIDADHHRQLVLKTKRRSPFTLAQMGQLLKQSFGVGIIFGSEALGFSDIEPALCEAFGRASDREVRVEVQSLTIPQGKSIEWKSELENLHDQGGRTPRMVLVVDVEDSAELPTVIQQSLEFCQHRRKAEQSWVRILVRLSPLAVKAWHFLPSETRLTLESAVDCVVAMSLWHPSIVQTHFKKGDRLGGQDVFDTIVQSTGGWPCLLDEVFQRCGEGQDPSSHAEAVSSELNSESALQTLFKTRCGATDLVVSNTIRDVLIEYAKAPCEADFLELAIDEYIDEGESASGILRTLVQLQLVQRTEKGLVVSPQVMQVLESRNV